MPRAKPGDMRAYRFGFNSNIGKWWVGPAEGSESQIIVCDELTLCELDVTCHPNGSMTCLAEMIADGRTFRFSDTGVAGTGRKIMLRLLREFDQTVNVPLTGSMRLEAKSPNT